MPVPKLKSNETERDYISRFEKFIHEENNTKPEDENAQTSK